MKGCTLIFMNNYDQSYLHIKKHAILSITCLWANDVTANWDFWTAAPFLTNWPIDTSWSKFTLKSPVSSRQTTADEFKGILFASNEISHCKRNIKQNYSPSLEKLHDKQRKRTQTWLLRHVLNEKMKLYVVSFDLTKIFLHGCECHLARKAKTGQLRYLPISFGVSQTIRINSEQRISILLPEKSVPFLKLFFKCWFKISPDIFWVEDKKDCNNYGTWKEHSNKRCRP